MHRRRVLRRATLVVVALLTAALLPSVSSAGHTTEAPYLTLDVPGTLTPLIESGDVHDGVMFEGIPDGIGLKPGAAPNSVDVFVNHEQSRVPFRGEADFLDSSVTRWTVDTLTKQIGDAAEPIPSSAGFIRFCSATMAGPAEGLSYTFFTNEESNDVLSVPPGAPYGPDPSLAPNRQAGYAVVLNPQTGAFRTVPGMGRHNHENTMVVPGGWNQIAVLSGDDTFDAPASQLYLYLANQESHIWEDKGRLWAFRVTHTNAGPVDPADPFNGANDYGDIKLGDDWKGEFIRVPKEVARGETAERPQTALENWSNANNVFQFIRVEDTAYDLSNPRVVYFADTGERRAVADPATGRLKRSPSSGPFGPYVNGRIFRIEFDANNPRKIVSFRILVDGDTSGPAGIGPIRQPDNLGTSLNSLMVQEDTSQGVSKIWRYDLGLGIWSVAAHVNDVDWESSGIVDASEWFGPGTWLLDVQAHGDFVNSERVGSVLFKREKGQLLLASIPGS
jgi:hypothetical protein